MNVVALITLFSSIHHSYGYNLNRVAETPSSTNQSLIVGGYAVSIKKFPFMAFLVIEFITRDVDGDCGATILTHELLLTAAHCLLGEIGLIHISIGSTYRTHGIKYKTPFYIRHPNYDATYTYYYDVGMVRTTSNMYIDKIATRVVVLATKESILKDDSDVTAVGWGYTKEAKNATLSSALRAVKIQVISEHVCQIVFGNRIKLTSGIFCAGDLQGGKDTCLGDSGGPVVNKDNVQVGVTSYGKTCGQAASPTIYTNIASVRDWIREEAGV